MSLKVYLAKNSLVNLYLYFTPQIVRIIDKIILYSNVNEPKDK